MMITSYFTGTPFISSLNAATDQGLGPCGFAFLRPHSMRQGDGTKHTGLVPESWRHDVINELVMKFWNLDIVVEQLVHLVPQPWEQMRLVHDSTSHHDALWRQRADIRHQPQGEIVGGQ